MRFNNLFANPTDAVLAVCAAMIGSKPRDDRKKAAVRPERRTVLQVESLEARETPSTTYNIRVDQMRQRAAVNLKEDKPFMVAWIETSVRNATNNRIVAGAPVGYQYLDFSNNNGLGNAITQYFEPGSIKAYADRTIYRNGNSGMDGGYLNDVELRVEILHDGHTIRVYTDSDLTAGRDRIQLWGELATNEVRPVQVTLPTAGGAYGYNSIIQGGRMPPRHMPWQRVNTGVELSFPEFVKGDTFLLSVDSYNLGPSVQINARTQGVVPKGMLIDRANSNLNLGTRLLIKGRTYTLILGELQPGEHQIENIAVKTAGVKTEGFYNTSVKTWGTRFDTNKFNNMDNALLPVFPVNEPILRAVGVIMPEFGTMVPGQPVVAAEHVFSADAQPHSWRRPLQLEMVSYQLTQGTGANLAEAWFVIDSDGSGDIDPGTDVIGKKIVAPTGNFLTFEEPELMGVTETNRVVGLILIPKGDIPTDTKLKAELVNARAKTVPVGRVLTTPNGVQIIPGRTPVLSVGSNPGTGQGSMTVSQASNTQMPRDGLTLGGAVGGVEVAYMLSAGAASAVRLEQVFFPYTGSGVASIERLVVSAQLPSGAMTEIGYATPVSGGFRWTGVLNIPAGQTARFRALVDAKKDSEGGVSGTTYVAGSPTTAHFSAVNPANGSVITVNMPGSATWGSGTIVMSMLESATRVGPATQTGIPSGEFEFMRIQLQAKVNPNDLDQLNTMFVDTFGIEIENSSNLAYSTTFRMKVAGYGEVLTGRIVTVDGKVRVLFENMSATLSSHISSGSSIELIILATVNSAPSGSWIKGTALMGGSYFRYYDSDVGQNPSLVIGSGVADVTGTVWTAA